MKKFIKSIPVYLTVVMLLCSMLVVPAFAASDSGDIIAPMDYGNNHLCSLNNDFDAQGWYSAVYLLPVGRYVIDYNFDYSQIPLSVIEYMSGTEDKIAPFVISDSTFAFYEYSLVPGSTFVVTEDMILPEMTDELAIYSGKCPVRVVSFGAPTVRLYGEPVQEGMYYQAFDMFADFFYGDGAALTGEQNMVLTILATTAVLFVVVVPFLILFFVLRLFR